MKEVVGGGRSQDSGNSRESHRHIKENREHHTSRCGLFRKEQRVLTVLTQFILHIISASLLPKQLLLCLKLFL
jgi:hypothetical protein